MLFFVREHFVHLSQPVSKITCFNTISGCFIPASIIAILTFSIVNSGVFIVSFDLLQMGIDIEIKTGKQFYEK